MYFGKVQGNSFLLTVNHWQTGNYTLRINNVFEHVRIHGKITCAKVSKVLSLDGLVNLLDFFRIDRDLLKTHIVIIYGSFRC